MTLHNIGDEGALLQVQQHQQLPARDRQAGGRETLHRPHVEASHLSISGLGLLPHAGGRRAQEEGVGQEAGGVGTRRDSWKDTSSRRCPDSSRQEAIRASGQAGLPAHQVPGYGQEDTRRVQPQEVRRGRAFHQVWNCAPGQAQCQRNQGGVLFVEASFLDGTRTFLRVSHETIAVGL